MSRLNPHSELNELLGLFDVTREGFITMCIELLRGTSLPEEHQQNIQANIWQADDEGVIKLYRQIIMNKRCPIASGDNYGKNDIVTKLNREIWQQ